jgi:hypothetical protein
VAEIRFFRALTGFSSMQRKAILYKIVSDGSIRKGIKSGSLILSRPLQIIKSKGRVICRDSGWVSPAGNSHSIH